MPQRFRAERGRVLVHGGWGPDGTFLLGTGVNGGEQRLTVRQAIRLRRSLDREPGEPDELSKVIVQAAVQRLAFWRR